MTPSTLLREVILHALAGKFRSDEAIVLLIAIALQESGLKCRDQREHPDGTDRVDGPALGLWQFEHGGGVLGVLTHASVAQMTRNVCMQHAVVPEKYQLWKALESDDILACKLARLLLWTDAAPLPRVGEIEKAWMYYQRNWRPGKPHKKTWLGSYTRAMEALS